MKQNHILYRGEAFAVTGNAVRQDSSHWAEVTADGQVKTMKNGRYSEWSIPPEGHAGPRYKGRFDVLNQSYRLALNEAGALLNEEGLFRTGANWPTVWTRDISYATHLGLGLWNVHACMKSLEARVRNGEVEQDTGTGGSWPISSDRVVWGMAAWEVYCLTGDGEWLLRSCRVLEKTCMRDEEVLVATGGLLRGESSFLDWREQTYPAWMTSADIGDSASLSTMILHASARKVLGRMFRELGMEEKSREWEEKGAALFGVIEKFFRIPEDALYGQFLYGRGYPVLSEKIDSLGNLLAVLLGQAHGSHAACMVASLPHCIYGIPCIHPQMPETVPPYHNRAIWPFLEGYYAQAAAAVGNEAALALAFACMVRAALLCGTNKENLLLETGLDEGLLLSSDSQLWSIAGMLGSFYKGLFGLRLSPEALEFRPCIPESFGGVHELTGLEYRGMTVDVRLSGRGRRIVRCMVNGKDAPAALPAGMKGRVMVELELASGGEEEGEVNLAHMGRNLSAPEWKASRHGLEWSSVEGADYYRVYRNGIPVSQTECCYYLPFPGMGEVYYQVMAVSLDGRESYLNEPNEYPSPDARTETRPCGLSGDEVWFSRVTDVPDALFYNVNVERPGVYRVDAFFANGTYDASDGNTCALRSLYLDGRRAGTLAFPHTSRSGNWEYFIYSTAAEVVLTPGPHRVEMVYDAFSENMNRLVNDMVIKHLRFTRIS